MSGLPQFVVANANTFEGVQRYLSQPAAIRHMMFIAVFAFAAGMIWVLLYLWERRSSARVAASRPLPTDFQRLCDAHEFTQDSVERLLAVARRLELRDPLPLFIDPRYLEQAGATDDGCRELGRRLFGSVFQEPQAAAQ